MVSINGGKKAAVVMNVEIILELRMDENHFWVVNVAFIMEAVSSR
jgi:hypothetical protein